MASAAATLIINVVGQTKGLVQAQAEVEGLGAKMGGFAKGVGAAALAAAAAAAVKVGVDSVNAFSALEQAMGGVDSVFKENAGTIHDWSKTAATSLGISREAAERMATSMGGQLKGLGIPTDQIAGKVQDLTVIAADLAATYGGTTADALESMGSLFRGEADPIEKYNVFLKQTDVNAIMAARGLDKLEGEAKKQAETQIRLEEVTRQSADAHGQFAKESDTWAHKTQVLAAKYEDLKASIGEKLVPVLITLWEWFDQKVMPVLQQVGDWIKTNLLPVLAQLWTWIQQKLVPVIQEWWAAFQEHILPVLQTLWEQIQTKVLPALQQLWEKFEKDVLPILRDLWAFLDKYVLPVVKVFAEVYIKYLVWQLVTLFDIIGKLLDALGWFYDHIIKSADAMMSFRTSAIEKVKQIWDDISDAISAAWDWLQKVAGWTGGAIISVIDGIRQAIGWLVDKAKEAWDWLNKIKSMGQVKVSDVIPGLPGGSSASAAVAVPGVSTQSSARVAPRSGSSVTINVNGALDPVAVARQLRTILRDDERRRSGVRIAAMA